MNRPVLGVFAICAFCGSVPQLSAQEHTLIHGFIREAGTGEAVGFATVRTADGTQGILSDRDGYFILRLGHTGDQRLQISALGFAPLDTVLVGSESPVEILLGIAPIELAEMSVTAPRTAGVSTEIITRGKVRRVPAALETDVLRSIQALPGVVSPSVLSSKLMVRGGETDQNLYLLDGYPVVYPYHLASGFSIFHIDAVRDAKFILGAPSAKYGGRLSSVLDVSLRDGNRERLTGTASLGLLSSSAVMEGPHSKGAWFVGARRTYIDALVGGAAGNEVPYYFMDGYAKSYMDLGTSDRVSALIFLGRDATWRAGNRNQDYFEWSNQVYGLSWRHLFGGRAVLEQRAYWSRYLQEQRGAYLEVQTGGIDTNHSVSLAGLRGDLTLWPGGSRSLTAGFDAQWRVDSHRVSYFTFSSSDSTSQSATSRAPLWAGYVEQEFTRDRLHARLGARGEISGAHKSVQPRLGLRYDFTSHVSATGAWAFIRQYSHLVEDPDVPLLEIFNVDLWRSANEIDIPAARSKHFVVGVDARLPWDLNLRLEGYRKTFDDILLVSPFDPLAPRFAIERLEWADGTATGFDLSLGREAPGPLRGWIGYSLTHSLRETGQHTFPASHHPLHRLVAVWDAETGAKWDFTGRFETFRGVPFTPAVATVADRPFDFGLGRFSEDCFAVNIEYLYGERNSARTGWSKRLDVGTSRIWKDVRGWTWSVTLSLINALFDPVGTFRPVPADRRDGCDVPAPIVREQELLLPPIPSVGIRVSF
jgi:hypothetical protein